MRSCIYEGKVRHRRFAPTEHSFGFSQFLMYLDLDELEHVFKGKWLWSAKLPNVAWFKRSDHFGDPEKSLKQTVTDRVMQDTGVRPEGRIGILTHLRYFGYCMNPVCFYYCWNKDETAVQTIVAEVHNTPWGETHCYTLDESRNLTGSLGKRYLFQKDFHVSPFMPMEQTYDWQFSDPSNRLAVHMTNLEDGKEKFDATMTMQRKPITSMQLARVLLRYPFMTAQVVGGIYYHAFRLWLKKTPFHPHPKHKQDPKAQVQSP